MLHYCIQQKNRVLGLLALLILSFNGIAQAPVNDLPCNAIVLTPSITCNYQTFTNANATPANNGAIPGIPAPGCANYQGGDVWFQVVVPAGGTLIFDTQTGVITDGGMAIYSGTCDNMTLIACDDDSSPNGAMSKLTANGLTPGSTVWVRIWEYGGNNNGTFGICVQIPPPPPTNDEACSAIPLTVGATCTYQTFTNQSATGSTGAPAPGCAGYLGGDVWFSVVVPAGGIVSLDTDDGVMTDGGMAVYSGATCDALTLISCDDNTSPNGNMPKLVISGQTPGSTLWVRVWENGNNNNGTFGICASIPPPPPVNDNPCNAITLTAGPTCTYQTFTNENATATTGVPAPGCANYQGGDVWFQVVVPAGGALIFDTQTGVITDGGMAVYTGTCDNLTLLACDDDSSPNGAMSFITSGGLTPGSTVWIRVWEYGGDNNGTFGICVKTPPPPPANDNPCTATALPVEATCNFQTFTNADATPTSTVPDPGCGGYVGGDVWFTVVVPASGSVSVDTRNLVMTDGGMAIYSGATCDALTLLSCDDNSSPNGNMPKVVVNGQTPGATLWIRVWENGNNNNGTFEICATIPPPPPANDNQCNATLLTASTDCNFQTFTNENATGSTGVASPTCATYAGFDVWFRVVVPAGGTIKIDTRRGTLLDGGMAVYRGSSCNTLTQIACDDNSSSSTNMPQLLISGQTPGNTLYIRFWGKNGADNIGTFDICVQIPPPPPANDDPCNAISLTANPTCSFQSFTSQSATGTTGVAAPTCGNYTGFDVWFSVVVPTGGALEIDTRAGTMVDGGMAVYRGSSCSSLTQIACDDNSSANTGMPFISLGGQTPGATLWIRVWSNTGTPGSGTFDICVSIPPAQANAFSFACAKEVIVGCGVNGSGCFNLSAVIPNIHASSSSYTVNPLGGAGGCFQPYINPGIPGAATNLTVDDVYTGAISLPFTFPFFGTNYNTVVASTNGLVSFDATRANAFSHYSILNSGGFLSATTGTPQDLPSVLYDKALIMGPYHDINPFYTTSPNRRIKYNVVGNAPHRKWILSFYKVPLFSSSCQNLINNTHQIVLYEGTGIVEVFVFEKEICTAWNQGHAMIGMQNFNRDQAIMAPGRKASDAPWGTVNMNESWRFTPATGPSLFKRVELIDTAGNIIATGDTTTLDATTFNVNFQNICPTSTDTVIKYIVKSTYAPFDNPGGEIYGMDTITVFRSRSLTVDVLTTNPRCNAGTDGTITINPTSGSAPYQYSLDHGTTFQAGNSFTLPAGTYTVTIKDNNNCSKDTTITITEPAAIYGGYTSTAVRCAGANNGSISVVANTGTAPFEYGIDGGAYQATGTFSVAGGSHVISIRDANGCVKDTTLNVVEPIALGTAVVSTNVRCNAATDGTITVTASNGTAPYSYSIDGINYQAGNSFTVPAGTYTVRIKDANDCIKDTAITISQPAVLAATAATNNATCSAVPNGQITVTANGGTAPFTYTIAGVSAPSGNVFTVAQGSYVVNVLDANNCPATVNASVGFTFDLTLRGRSDTAVCDNAGVNLFTNSNATNYSWSPTTNLDNAAIASPVATPTQTTSYELTASTGTCVLKDTVTITVSESPIVDAGQDITIVKGDDANLLASIGNAANFTWSPTTYLNNPNSVRPVALRPQETTTYRLTVFNSLGCSKYDEVKVIVLPYCIKVKNAFTPNGDGINDNWVVFDQFDCLKNVSVSIFNRYGSKVYESRNYRNDWKGTYNGKSLPDATYYYVISFELIDGRVQEMRGDVTILR
ncbi:MAG: hypothetical protein RLY16_59 [Bacteroidota bacterium]